MPSTSLPSSERLHAGTPPPAGADPKWSDDAFLDTLRAATDPPADRATAELLASPRGLAATNALFKMMRVSSTGLPDDAPASLRTFADTFEEAAAAIGPLDASGQRGAEFFGRNVFPAALAMLASSLPSGYSAPCLCRILTISDDLGTHPFQRLLGVVQLLVDISTPPNVGRHDCSHWAATKLRLLHAGVRNLVPRYRPDYVDRFGPPVNREDMLATIMGFSLLVIDGIRAVGLRVDDDEADGYWALWRHFSRLMGIAPAEDPASTAWVPTTLEDARAFYAAYQRRHFCDRPADNPDGVMLTQRNLELMISLLPRRLHRLGLGGAPRTAMTVMLGERGMARVGLEPHVAHGLRKVYYDLVLRTVSAAEHVGNDFVHHLSETLLQDLIDVELGRVSYCVPNSVLALRRLADPAAPNPGTPGPDESQRPLPPGPPR